MHWQPIETAPKDGTEILVCDPFTADGKPTTCWGLSIQVAAWWAEEGEGKGEWVVYCSLPSEPRLHFEPTHWAPLPDPPGEAEKHKPLLSIDKVGNVSAVDERTLRDHFAMAAVQGLIACEAFHGPVYQQHPEAAASFAYAVADAMLKERDR